MPARPEKQANPPHLQSGSFTRDLTPSSLPSPRFPSAIGPGEPRILAVGRLHRQKDMPRLLRAFALVLTASLRIWSPAAKAETGQTTELRRTHSHFRPRPFPRIAPIHSTSHASALMCSSCRRSRKASAT